MDNAGISYIVVSTSAPGIQGVSNITAATLMAIDINDEMFEKYVQPHPSRFGFFATVPLQNATAAALELERAVTVLGAKGAMIYGYTEVTIETTGAVDIVYLDDPRCRPFWAKVNELGVPIYIHPRAPPISQQLMFNHADNTHSKYPGLVTAGWGFTAEAAVHALRLMLSGLFDEYPSVQILLGHAAEGLPFLIHRIDTQLSGDAAHHYALYLPLPRSISPLTNTPPSGVPTHLKPLRHYLRTNVYATLSGIRRLSTVRCTLDEMGEERVLFSVDYPFQSDQDQADWFDGVEGIGVQAKKRIGWGNARGLLGLEGVGVGEGWIEGEEFR